MKHIKYLLCLALVVFYSQSCTDLEEEVFDQFTEENFFQNEQQIVSAFGAAYTSLYGYTGTVQVVPAQEITSDEAVVPTRGNDWNDGGNWRRLHTQQYTSEDDVIVNAWNFLFAGVSNTNRLIFQFENLTFDGKEGVLAELKALRAIFYLWIMDIYGNAPIVTDFDVPSGFLPDQSTRAQIFSFVEKELTDALPVLSSDVASTYGRVNQFVARTALAKLYLNAQVYSGTARYQDALTQANAVINSGKFTFSSNYAAMFAPDNGQSAKGELIFAIPYDAVFAQGFNLIQQTLHYASQQTYNSTDQPWNGWCALEEFYKSYEDGDIRKVNNFLVGPQFSASGVRLIDSGAESTDPDGPPLTFTPEINELGLNTLRQAGARIGKYAFELGSTANMNNDFPIFRYSDVLLMKAECLLRLNQDQAGALALVNQIRARAGVAPFTSLTLENLLAERGRELFFEAHRRTDLIRFGEFNKAWWEKPATDPHVNIFPIPRSALDSNSKLKQNPGY